MSKEADECLTQFFGKSVRLVRKGPTVRPSVSYLAATAEQAGPNAQPPP